MLKTLLFVAIIATVQCSGVEEKLKERPVIKYQPPYAQGQRLDGSRPRSDWSYYFPSWSHYFSDDDDVDEAPNLLKRLAALEKEVKELNELLKKETTGAKKPESPTTPKNKVEAASPNKDAPAKTPKDKVPEKTEKKPVNHDKKPAQPEEDTETHGEATDSKEPSGKPEEPPKAAETTHDKHPPKESSQAKDGGETAP